jgi:HNH endonuclease
VNRLRPKRPRVKLQGDCYVQLCRQVLERDNWRCLNCGRASELQIHHIQFRSLLGDDSERNLVTLCAACHKDLHVSSQDVGRRSCVTRCQKKPCPRKNLNSPKVGPIAGGLIADCERRTTNRLLPLVRYDENNSSGMQQASAGTFYSDCVVSYCSAVTDCDGQDRGA